MRRAAPAAGGARRLGAGARAVRRPRWPAGSAAARQRRAFGRRGELTDVVDALLAHTQGRDPGLEPPATVPVRARAARRLPPDGFDEAVSADGDGAAATYGWMFRALGPARARAAWPRPSRRCAPSSAPAASRSGSATASPTGCSRSTWCRASSPPRTGPGLTAGLTQRVRALEAFLRDVYGERRIVADGVDPRLGRRRRARAGTGWARSSPADAVRIAVAGIDLVRDRADHWLVLEDNLRVPSGIGYAIMTRRLIRSVMPDLEPPAGVVGLEAVPGQLRAALLVGRPSRTSRATTRSRCCRPARSTRRTSSTGCSPSGWACRW